MVSGSGPTVFGLFPGAEGVGARAGGGRRAARAPPARRRRDARSAARSPSRVDGLSVHPAWLAGAVALALYLVVRRRAHGRVTLVVGGSRRPARC